MDQGDFSTTQTLKEVDEVLNLYNEQINYEALHIFPLIFEYEPSIWNNYTTEHNTISKLAEKIRSLIQSYNSQQGNNNKSKIKSSISASFNEFILANFNHMDDEEAVLNEILWRYYDDNILRKIEHTMNILPHLLKAGEKTGFAIATAA
jgi:hypothetical protein